MVAMLQELAYKWINEYRKEGGQGWSELSEHPQTLSEYNAIFDKYVREGYRVYAEYREGRYHVFVKRLTEVERTYAVRENTTDINREYADLSEKYGTAWADAFNKVQGRGWQRLPFHPRTTEERNKVFVEYARKGYAVYTESRYSTTYIYVKKIPPATAVHIEEIKKAIMDYRKGYIGASTAIEDIDEIIRRM